MSIEKLKSELRKFVEFDEKAAQEYAKSVRYAENLLEAIEVLDKIRQYPRTDKYFDSSAAINMQLMVTDLLAKLSKGDGA